MGRFSSLELEETQQSESQNEGKDIFSSERQNAETILKKAIENFQRCDFEQSMKFFARVLSFDNGNAFAWMGQIKCLINLHELKEAIMWTDKAVEIIGENANFLAAKSCAYCRMGDFSKAYAYSDASLEQKGASSYVWLCRGEVLLQQKRKNYDFCFDKAISAQSESWDILVEVARIYMFYNKNAIALTYLEKAKEKNPTESLIWYELGNCYINMGVKGKAIKSLSHALELNPEMEMANILVKKAESSGFFSRILKRYFRE